MTIGDEKVVAFMYVLLDENGSYNDWTFSDEPCTDPFGIPGEDFSEEYTVETTQLVAHSAYAELAAELAEWKAQVNKLRYEVHVTLKEQLTAESQLAELRGRVDGLADAWESEAAGTWGESKEHATLQECADDLRTLAAADGG